MDYKHDLNSDDDFDCSNGYSDNYNNNGRLANPNGLSKAELRKTNKPIMEKRRRARINHCLNELKSLILEAMKKDPARHTKLEKADILEMTVKHLQSVQRQQLNMAIQTDPSVVQKFKTGFVECAEEVNRYVSQLDGIDVGVRQRLSAHLNNCANSLEQIGSMSNFNNGYRGQMTNNSLFATAAAASAAPTPLFPSLPQDLNNNSTRTDAAPAIQMGGLQLIPSRLPSGEFALIMPNTTTNASTTTAAPCPVPPVGAFAWPTSGPVLANPTHLSDYAQSFRLSALSKPSITTTTNSSSGSNSNANTTIPAHQTQHGKSQTTSPPLSPISSISSHGEESRAASPTAEQLLMTKHSFAGVFSTPPPTSAETSFNTSGSLNLSGGSHDSSASSRSLIHLQQQQVSSTSGPAGAAAAAVKREREQDPVTEQEKESGDSSDCSLDEPSSKKFLAAAIEKSSQSAWRPW